MTATVLAHPTAAEFVVNKSCPACSHAELTPTYVRADQIPVLRCDNCDFHFVARYPRDLSVWYQDDYYKASSDNPTIGYQNYEALDPFYHTWAISLVRIFREQGSLYDLGCSNGRFLELAKAAGFTNLSGIEFNDDYAARCRDKGFKVDAGDFLAAEVAANTFDIVTAWSVLEHIPDIQATLIKVRRILNPCGLLVFEVPILTGDPSCDRAWLESSLEHVSYFTERSLHVLCTKFFGFSPIGRRVDFTSYGSTFVGCISADAKVMAQLAPWGQALREQDLSGVVSPSAQQLTALAAFTSRYLNSPAGLFKVADALPKEPKEDIAAYISSYFVREFAKAWKENIDYFEAKKYFLERISNLESKNGQLAAQANALERMQKESISRATALEKDNKRFPELIAYLEEQNRQLEQDLLARDSERNAQLMAPVAAQAARIAKWRERTLNMRRQQLKDALARAESAEQRAAHFETQTQTLSGQVQDLQARIAGMEAFFRGITSLRIWRIRAILQAQPFSPAAWAQAGVLLCEIATGASRRLVRRFLRSFGYKADPRIPCTLKPWPKDRPLISVIMPSYNYGRFMPEAVASVLAQTFQDFELLIIDCSDDPDTITYVRGLSHPKVRVIFRDGRHLLGDNRNFGIERARGKYVCTFDPDDIMRPTYLEKAVYTLETERCDIVSPSLEQFGEASGVWHVPPVPELESLLIGNQISVLALFSRAAWKKAGGYYDYGVGASHVHEDWDFWIRMMGHGARVRNLHEPLMLYRKHGSNMSGDKKIPPLDQQREKIRKHNAAVLTPEHLIRSRIKQARQYRVKNKHVNLLRTHVRQGRADSLGGVLFALPYVVVGGVAGRFFELGRYLTQRGAHVVVATTESVDERQVDTSQTFTELTSDIFPLPACLTNTEAWTDFVDYLIQSRDIKTLVLGGSRFFYTALPELKRRHPNLRVVDQQFNTGCHFASNREFSSFIDHTVAENTEVYNLLLREHHEPVDRVSLIPNGVNFSAIGTRKAERPAGLPSDKLIVSFIGRLSHEKGPDIFVDIAAALAKDERLHFVLAGPGLLLEELRERTERNGLAGRITIPGYINTSEYLAATDVLVVPSRLDGRPNVVMEAFARGVPVVAARVGGLPDLIKDGQTGVLCHPEDFADFARKLEQLLADEPLRLRIADAAKRYALESLDDAKFMQGYERIFPR